MKQQNGGTLIEGIVLDIQRMSTEDGPGIRTTVFMKGCTLHCAWCHNPESISAKPQVQWIGSRCIGCGTCLDVCPEGAISDEGNGIQIDRGKCTGCGTCAEECPSTAMELLGNKWSVDDLAVELLKDRVYFEKSGGGVTIGGGESTFQAVFISSLLEKLSASGVHTAIDTCGQTSRDSLEKILPFTDLVLYDIKEIDSARHRNFTGIGNEKILDNIIYIGEYIKKNNGRPELWIRTPVIPDATAREENIRGIGEFIARNLGDSVRRWELLAFNNLCEDKYLRLGREWIYKKNKLMSRESMEYLYGVALKTGIRPDIVSWSGATKIEDEKNTKDPVEQERLRLIKGSNVCSPQ